MARKIAGLLIGVCVVFVMGFSSYARAGATRNECIKLFDLTKEYLMAVEKQDVRNMSKDDEEISFRAVSMWQKSNTLLHNFLSFQPTGEKAKEFFETMKSADSEPTSVACKLLDEMMAEDSTGDIDLTAQSIVLEDMVKAKVLGIDMGILKEQTMPMDPTILRALTYGQSLQQTGKMAQGQIDTAKAQGASGKIIPEEFKHNYVGQFGRLVDCIGELKKNKGSGGTSGGGGGGATDPADMKNDMASHPTKDPTGAECGNVLHPGPADLSKDVEKIGRAHV